MICRSPEIGSRIACCEESDAAIRHVNSAIRNFIVERSARGLRSQPGGLGGGRADHPEKLA